MDLRKTKVRPKYVPNPTDNNVKSTAIFRVTGAASGGGGATGVGGNSPTANGGTGGAGMRLPPDYHDPKSTVGTPGPGGAYYIAGGGGGGAKNGTPSSGGAGGDGGGGTGGGTTGASGVGTNAIQSTGGGGGGNGSGGNLNIYGGGGNGHGSHYSYGNHTAGSSSMGGTQPSSHRQSNYSHRHQSHCAWGAGGNGSMHGNRGARGREGCVVVYEYYS